ncbi:MAG TPA: cation:proton antiporter, partial [Herpetosiphonaceae bacterium]
MHPDAPFMALLVITLLALLVPVLVSRLPGIRLPIVVGEILAGMAVGQSGLQLIAPSATLQFLQEFGFVFLMFLSGLELDVQALFLSRACARDRSQWQQPLPLALLSFSLTVLLAVGIGVGLVQLGLARNALLMGLILITTSLGIVVPVLKERGLTTSSYGQVVLLTALLSDFVTLLLLSVVIALFSRGLSLDLLLFGVLLAAFALAVKLGPWFSRVPWLTRLVDELSHATAQVRVRGALLLLVAWVVLAETLGVEIILGAFLAGAIVRVSRRKEGSPLPEKLDALGYGFFIPLFFILVGAQFDARVLLGSPSALLLVPLLIVAAYAVKLLPALLLRALFGWRETVAAGMLLSSRLSLIIAASAIALDLGLIAEATNAALILVAIVTCTASPILFNRILPYTASTERSGVIICGTDQLAELLGERLRRSGESITCIGRDQERLQAFRHAGFLVGLGDPTDGSIWDGINAQRARALIVTSSAPGLVVDVCRQARQRYGIPTVIARVDDPALVRQLAPLDVQVVQPAFATALALEGALHFPSAFALLMDQADDV